MALYVNGGKIVVAAGGGWASTGGGGGAVHAGDSVPISGSGFPSAVPSFFFAGDPTGTLETTSVGSLPSSPDNGGIGPGTPNTPNWNRFTLNYPAGAIINDGTRGKVFGLTISNGTDGECTQEVTYGSTLGFNDKIMISYWIRMAVTDTGPNPDQQYKFIRFQNGTSNISDLSNGQFYCHSNALGGVDNIVQVSPLTGADTWFLGAGSSLPVLDGNWQFIEFKLIMPSGQGTSDGQFYFRRSRTSLGTYASNTSGSGKSLQSQVNFYPTTDRASCVTLQNGIFNGYTNLVFAQDDHHVQTKSFFRVLLCDTANPATATIWQMQRITACSPTQVTITANPGPFTGNGFWCVMPDSLSDTPLLTQAVTIA